MLAKVKEKQIRILYFIDYMEELNSRFDLQE